MCDNYRPFGPANSHYQKLEVRDHMKVIHEINICGEHVVSTALTTRALVHSLQSGVSPIVGPGVAAIVGAVVGAAGVCWSP